MNEDAKEDILKEILQVAPISSEEISQLYNITLQDTWDLMHGDNRFDPTVNPPSYNGWEKQK